MPDSQWSEPHDEEAAQQTMVLLIAALVLLTLLVFVLTAHGHLRSGLTAEQWVAIIRRK